LSTLVMVLGGMLGAAGRLLAERQFPPSLRSAIATNVVGSFVLGFLTGAVLIGTKWVLVGTALSGMLIGYSVFSTQTTGLFERGVRGFGQAVLTIFAGFAAGAWGVVLAAAVLTA
jgi:fluoride ion exporter CrcB/FEX